MKQYTPTCVMQMGVSIVLFQNRSIYLHKAAQN